MVRGRQSFSLVCQGIVVPVAAPCAVATHIYQVVLFSLVGISYAIALVGEVCLDALTQLLLLCVKIVAYRLFVTGAVNTEQFLRLRE